MTRLETKCQYSYGVTNGTRSVPIMTTNYSMMSFLYELYIPSINKWIGQSPQVKKMIRPLAKRPEVGHTHNFGDWFLLVIDIHLVIFDA